MKLTSTDNVVLVTRSSGETVHVPVTAPIVNLNGACLDDLIEQEVSVLVAIEKARKAIQAAFPHPRDFQVGDFDGTKYDSACREARVELDALNIISARHDEIRRRLSSQPYWTIDNRTIA